MSYTHIFRMTDDTGMLQHAKYNVPDPSQGYTTDDNARALIMAAMLYETHKNRKYLDLIYRYQSFLLYARKGQWFRNFMNYDRIFIEEKGSQDCFGRCIWSLGHTVACSCLPEGIRKTARFLLRETAGGCRELQFLRAKAYAVLGLHKWGGDFSEELVRKLASKIAAAYDSNADTKWRWFERKITYCNSVLPWAMLEAHEATREEMYLRIGLESLEFLSDITFRHGIFRPVGCNGWFEKGKARAEYDQQPVEACETLLVCLKAYQLTREKKYLDRAERCVNWYTGLNERGNSLIDPDTGGCMDGITADGLNLNEGAESLISWHIASLAWDKVKQRRVWGG